ncbi:MAG: hypothetical protein WCV85_05770 [Patescibacteria group bacterium]
MFHTRTPEKSIRISVIWLAVLAVTAGFLAAHFGPKSSAAVVQTDRTVSALVK